MNTYDIKALADEQLVRELLHWSYRVEKATSSAELAYTENTVNALRSEVLLRMA